MYMYFYSDSYTYQIKFICIIYKCIYQKDSTCLLILIKECVFKYNYVYYFIQRWKIIILLLT